MIHIYLSSGAGKIGQLVVDVPSGHGLTSPRPKGLKKKKLKARKPAQK
jgi:hypothetical protein